MKLVMVISGLGIGGAELSLLNIVEKLHGKVQIQVVSLSQSGPVGKRLLDMGVHVETLNMKSFLSSIPAFFRLVKLLREINPDVVHTWMYHADCIGGLAARCARVPGVVWSLHSSNLKPGMVKLSTRFLVKICAIISWVVPHKIISCSQISSKVHKAIGYDSRKIVLIPNGIDVFRFTRHESARFSVRRELGLSPETMIIGVIGRFDVQKNHVGFFEASGFLHKKYPTVHFLLAGSGIDAANDIIRDAMTAVGVESVTHLLGVRDDIPRLMSALDVLVSSSDGEAFPLVLGEAMACGVPCVVTNVGDSALIVGDTGSVVAPGDMEGLAAAIENIILLPPDERNILGQRARMRINENFNMLDILTRYERIYYELSGHGIEVD